MIALIFIFSSLNDQVKTEVRVVCRQGAPWEEDSLSLVSIRTARGIVILADDNSLELADAKSLKTLLAICNCLPVFYEDVSKSPSIVVEIMEQAVRFFEFLSFLLAC